MRTPPPLASGLSLQVLKRCGWRVVLREQAEVQAAHQALAAQPDYLRLCAYVRECARSRCTPLGTHGHSREAEAALLYNVGSPHGRQGGGSASKARSAAVPHSDSSSKSAQSGLDGTYWQSLPEGHGRRRSSGQQQRRVLVPHNH